MGGRLFPSCVSHSDKKKRNMVCQHHPNQMWFNLDAPLPCPNEKTFWGEAHCRWANQRCPRTSHDLEDRWPKLLAGSDEQKSFDYHQTRKKEWLDFAPNHFKLQKTVSHQNAQLIVGIGSRPVCEPFLEAKNHPPTIAPTVKILSSGSRTSLGDAKGEGTPAALHGFFPPNGFVLPFDNHMVVKNDQSSQIGKKQNTSFEQPTRMTIGVFSNQTSQLLEVEGLCPLPGKP